MTGRRSGIVSLALVALAAACSGTGGPPVTQVATDTATVEPTPELELTPDEDPPESEPTPTPSPTPDEPTKDEPTEVEATDEPTESGGTAVLTYLEALASRDPSQLHVMLDAAVEGSPAAAYAAYQAAAAEALAASGRPHADPDDVRVTDEGVDLCPAFSDECASFTDIEVDGDLVVTFSVGDIPIAPRIAADPVEVESTGVVGTLVAGYQDGQGSLTVIARVVNNNPDPIFIHVHSWDYIAASGGQVTSVEGVGPIDLRAGAAALVAGTFSQQDIGGTAYLSGSTEDFSSWELEFPIAATFP